MGLLFHRNFHRVNNPIPTPSPYTPAATSLAWQSVQNNPAALGITGNAIAVVKDQRGVVMAGLIPTYVSGTPATATIATSGIYTTVANGSTVITASYLALTAINTTITVQQVTASITLSPASPTVASGTAQVFTAAGKDSNNVTCTLGAGTWLSSDPTDFPVTSGGSVTPSVTSGSAVIKFTETSSGVYGTTTITASVTYGLFTDISTFTGAAGATHQLTVKYGVDFATGTDVTTLASYSSANTAIASIDAPTLTGVSTPSSITQGTGPITFTWPCTNPRTIQSLGGLETGVTASGPTVVDSTHISFDLTATGGATATGLNVFLVDTAHGNSGTQTLTVNTASALPTTGLVRRYVASSGTNTTTNGAAITSWVDTIAGASLAVGGTPGLQYVSSALNGKPGIIATNPPGSFAESTFDSAINTASTTWGLVFKLSGSVSGYPQIMGLQAGNQGAALVIPAAAALQADVWNGTSNTNTSNATLAPSTAYVATLVIDGTAHTAALYIENVLVQSITVTYVPTTAGLFALFGAVGGSYMGAITICESLVWDHVFTPTERTNLASYVSTTYAI